MSETQAAFGNLVGHTAAIEELRASFASGRMHHAWMIVGIDGIGKSSLAWHIANHALSNGENPIGSYNPNNRVTKLIQAEAHPDLLVVRRAVDDKTGELRNGIVVDQALKVASFLRKTSTHGGWRVVIIDEAHRMNRNGENAILKILEEPPAHTLILMTATTPGAMLPTIRSRCRVLKLSALSDGEMRTILARSDQDLKDTDVKSLIELSGGSVGFALKIASTGALNLYNDLMQLIEALPQLDIARLHKIADQISKKADVGSYEVIRALISDRLRAAAKAAALAQQSDDARNCLAAMERIDALFDTADHANLDKKLAFIRVVSDIRDARVAI